MSSDVAMQSRCLYCLREQYALAVWEVSSGRLACVWCKKMSKVMTEKEYQKKLKQRSKPDSDIL